METNGGHPGAEDEEGAVDPGAGDNRGWESGDSGPTGKATETGALMGGEDATSRPPGDGLSDMGWEDGVDGDRA